MEQFQIARVIRIFSKKMQNQIYATGVGIRYSGNDFSIFPKGHSSEKVTRKIPVYVAYFTAWPDLSGKVEFFGDVYDRDARLKTAMDKTDAARAAVSG